MIVEWLDGACVEVKSEEEVEEIRALIMSLGCSATVLGFCVKALLVPELKTNAKSLAMSLALHSEAEWAKNVLHRV